MTGLSSEEQHYLVAAFAASPREWFLPRTVNSRDFAPNEVDRIVESLADHGLMQAEPNCHARLTDRGRTQAAQLKKLANRNWRKFNKRRKTRIVIAGTVVGMCALLLALKLAGLI